MNCSRDSTAGPRGQQRGTVATTPAGGCAGPSQVARPNFALPTKAICLQQSVASEETVALSQPSVSRILFSVAEAIATVGKAKGWVKFPTATEKVVVKQRFLERGKLPGVVGCVDGTLIAIVRPRKMSPAETEAYWSRKGFYALNCMVVCDANLRIMAIDPRMPGSCHDSFVWRHSALRRRLTCGLLNDEEFLLGDSGYPLEPWLLAPVPGHPTRLTAEGRYNEAHAVVRNAAERCIGILKSRFRCLQSYRTLHYSPRKAATIVTACAALHNLCLQAEDPLPDDPEDDDTSCTSDAATRQVQPPQAPSLPLAQVVPPPRALFESAKQARSAIINMFRLPRNLHIAYLQSVRRRMRPQMRRRQT
ncbi:hypothetical protein HPB49_008384 [Dermacentor silvarum]|uniref:Uncharacterized protein n=1 Tax=Dermacentor silvarum TaxID=543639 RepID=A0ACB8CQT5_DERSI|nr:hypothetical protein HPB49_008384 [Dermacentor silvarum]